MTVERQTAGSKSNLFKTIGLSAMLLSAVIAFTVWTKSAETILAKLDRCPVRSV
jgi:hypothetical protein